MVEKECLFLVLVLKELEMDPSIDIYSLFGTLLVNIPLDDDDEDESQESLAVLNVPQDLRHEDSCIIQADMQVEVKESISQIACNPKDPSPLAGISHTVLFKGHKVLKA